MTCFTLAAEPVQRYVHACSQMARVTFPERMHLVHTFALLILPSSLILTVWILAFHFLFECLLEWETLLPETCPLPQISHFLDMSAPPFRF